MSDAIQEQRLRWFESSLYEGEDYTPIFDHATWQLKDIQFAEQAIASLSGQLHKSRARTPSQLRKWCCGRIDRLAEKLNPHKREKKPRKNQRDFEAEIDGDVCRQTLYYTPIKGPNAGVTQEHIFSFPLSWLPEATEHWPYHLKKYIDGRFYVAKKHPVPNPNGTTSQKDVPLHRLFLGLSPVIERHEDNPRIICKNKNWLDYTNGNVCLFKASAADYDSEYHIFTELDDSYDPKLVDQPIYLKRLCRTTDALDKAKRSLGRNIFIN